MTKMTNIRQKIALVSAGLAAFNTVKVMVGEGKEKWEDHTRYTARINEDSYVYRSLMSWINDQVVSRHVKIISEYTGVRSFYDSISATKVNIKGHTLEVSIQKPSLTDDSGGRTFDSEDSILSDNLVFVARNKEGIDALQTFLEELTEQTKTKTREVYLYNVGSYGWDAKEYRRRSIDSVFLPEGEMESLVADIESFIENEERYSSIGAPWHRGYLLYGEPGNGKSSLVSAIASHFKFHLYNMPLSGVKSDHELAEKINKIQPQSILLLEDVDIFTEAVSRDGKSKKEGPTLAGLLNALDGVSTPHGLLTVMTTNRKEFLDEALIRSGRMDYQIKLSKPVRTQVENMYHHVYGQPLNVKPKQFNSMADLTDVFKTNANDPEAARVAIKSS